MQCACRLGVCVAGRSVGRCDRKSARARMYMHVRGMRGQQWVHEGQCAHGGVRVCAWGLGAGTAPLQALIICNTISAAPRLCSRDCWYRSRCFSISFSWWGAGFGAQQPSLGLQGLVSSLVCLPSSSHICHPPSQGA